MREEIVGRVLWRAGEDTDFRRRLLRDMGNALAEEGFVLSDGEMTTLRDFWDRLQGLSERIAHEHIMAWARSYRRERR